MAPNPLHGIEKLAGLFNKCRQAFRFDRLNLVKDNHTTAILCPTLKVYVKSRGIEFGFSQLESILVEFSTGYFSIISISSVEKEESTVFKRHVSGNLWLEINLEILTRRN